MPNPFKRSDRSDQAGNCKGSGKSANVEPEAHGSGHKFNCPECGRPFTTQQTSGTATVPQHTGTA